MKPHCFRAPVERFVRLSLRDLDIGSRVFFGVNGTVMMGEIINVIYRIGLSEPIPDLVILKDDEGFNLTFEAEDLIKRQLSA